MSGDNPDIRSLSFPELELAFKESGERKFRGAQVWEWLWNKYCRSFDSMTNLPVATRQMLTGRFSFPAAQLHAESRSSDGTVKMLFRLNDGALVEGVLIPSGERTTACISSQAGCQLNCSFCATGAGGFTRNLLFHEIVDQVAILNALSVEEHGAQLSNIVYMGMGEPFLNYPAVKKSIEKITDPEGFGFSPQRITVSSVGIPEMIRKMADEGARFQFALSLHAASNGKRSAIIPVNKKYPLEDLSEALIEYHRKTSKRFTIEYILLGKFNDTLADARDLALFCRSFPVKINLIEYNPGGNPGFQRSHPETVRAFRQYLEQKNMVVNLRKSRGTDIAAACGQLAGNYKP